MSDNNQYGSFNRSSNSNQRKNSGAGDFKIQIDYNKSELFSNSQKPSSRHPYQSRQRPVQRPTTQANRPGNVNAATRKTQTSFASRKPSQSANAPRVSKQVTSAKRTTSAPKVQNTQKPSKKTRLTPAQIAVLKEERKNARIKSLVAFIVCVVFIALVTIPIVTIAKGTINDILAIDKENNATISVVVEKGDGFDEVFDALCDSGLVSRKLLVKLFCRYRGYNGKKVSYEPGVYYFESSDGIEAMLEEIMVNSGKSNSVIRLTFPEGWSIAKIFEKIEKYEVCSAEKLYANLDIVARNYKFYEGITSKAGRYKMSEGYLFPDTYEFYIGESASSVLKKIFSNFEKKWSDEFESKRKQLGLSVDEVITIASIIQREAAGNSRMADISSVIHNRLKSSDYRNLRCDSVTDYISSLNDMKLLSEYDYNAYFEAYNTYSVKGLPPGPICNPGIAAINAALNPTVSNYYFFAHDSNGNLYLASSFAEHQANLSKVLQN